MRDRSPQVRALKYARPSGSSPISFGRDRSFVERRHASGRRRLPTYLRAMPMKRRKK